MLITVAESGMSFVEIMGEMKSLADSAGQGSARPRGDKELKHLKLVLWRV